ncbi:hypothetical protein VXE44_23590, partial [Acinetobacter nosocomialis]|uniref:hypothetical protein n=1 Tax=Acinetobacter nosocomialis TaxID=106654 RepID=UPI0030FA5433
SSELIALIRLVQDYIADRVQTIRDQQIDYPSVHVVNLLQQQHQGSVSESVSSTLVQSVEVVDSQPQDHYDATTSLVTETSSP